MKIFILDSDPVKCNDLGREAALATAGIPVTFIVEEYTDEETIKKFNPSALPAIVVDGKIKSSGKYLTKKEIHQLLKEEFEARTRK